MDSIANPFPPDAEARPRPPVPIDVSTDETAHLASDPRDIIAIAATKQIKTALDAARITLPVGVTRASRFTVFLAPDDQRVLQVAALGIEIGLSGPEGAPA